MRGGYDIQGDKQNQPGENWRRWSSLGIEEKLDWLVGWVEKAEQRLKTLENAPVQGWR